MSEKIKVQKKEKREPKEWLHGEKKEQIEIMVCPRVILARIFRQCATLASAKPQQQL